MGLHILVTAWPKMAEEQRANLLSLLPRSFPTLTRRLSRLGNQITLGERDLGWFRGCETTDDVGVRYIEMLMDSDRACRAPLPPRRLR
jgi:hypothetical protein